MDQDKQQLHSTDALTGVAGQVRTTKDDLHIIEDSTEVIKTADDLIKVRESRSRHRREELLTVAGLLLLACIASVFLYLLVVSDVDEKIDISKQGLTAIVVALVAFLFSRNK